jgi:DAK2 domain fusion protein YloV
MISINIKKFKEMLSTGCNYVSEEYEYINELNVFPVPDGDTGTNLKITLEGAMSSIQNTNFEDIFTLGKKFAFGVLMNARGNSGVIFSQILKGFVKEFPENSTEITITDLHKSFSNAKSLAYASVSTPVEGTILTVIRVIDEKLNKNVGKFQTITDFFKFVVDEGEIILAKTPEILPELKEVGVVDSGGYGLVKFLTGMYDALLNKVGQKTELISKNVVNKQIVTSLNDNNEGFGYCCEFIMMLNSKVSVYQKNKLDFDLEDFKNKLSKIGDSMVVVKDENVVKVHIHSLTPYRVLEIGAKYGEFNKVKIENMTAQFIERNPGTTLESMSNMFKKSSELPNQTKIIATVPSSTFVTIFNEQLNIANVINTEITGNPSIQEFVNQIKKINSSKIIIIVDDSNIILAAQHAIDLMSKNISIELISSKDIISSYIACLSFDPIKSYDSNIKNMNSIIRHLDVGKVSISSKDVSYSHINIKKDDTIGIIGKKIVSNSKTPLPAIRSLIDHLAKNNKKRRKAYICCGKGYDEIVLRNIQKYFEERYNVKTEIVFGNQPVYSYYFALI